MWRMTEKILTQTQVEDAQAHILRASASIDTFGVRDPMTAVPRPAFADVVCALDKPDALRTGMLRLSGQGHQTTARFPGLRGVAWYRTPSGLMGGPAIVLPQNRGVAVLTAETNPDNFSELTHALLENEYVTRRPDIAAHVNAGGNTKVVPAIGGHALIAASFAQQPGLAHGKVHQLAESSRGFGTAFTSDGESRRDFVVGHSERRVRSAALPLAKVVLDVAERYQMNPEQRLIGGGLAASELNIAMVAAAALSKGKVDIGGNMRAMAGI